MGPFGVGPTFWTREDFCYDWDNVESVVKKTNK